jgi:hypothetical protein
MQLPDFVAKATILAVIQEKLLDKSQKQPGGSLNTKQSSLSSKSFTK